MKDRSTLYLACAALGTLALAAAPAPQAHDGDAHAQASTQQLNSQRNRNDLVKIVKRVTAQYVNQPVSRATDDGYQLLFGCVSDDDSVRRRVWRLVDVVGCRSLALQAESDHAHDAQR